MFSWALVGTPFPTSGSCIKLNDATDLLLLQRRTDKRGEDCCLPPVISMLVLSFVWSLQSPHHEVIWTSSILTPFVELCCQSRKCEHGPASVWSYFSMGATCYNNSKLDVIICRGCKWSAHRTTLATSKTRPGLGESHAWIWCSRAQRNGCCIGFSRLERIFKFRNAFPIVQRLFKTYTSYSSSRMVMQGLAKRLKA